jgi:hypothetical protein
MIAVYNPLDISPWPMDKLLRHHIVDLETRVQRLSQEIMQNRKTRTERNNLETELRVAQQALAHYQQAINLESQLQRH